MNIKQAKQEIVNAVHAYLAKDETGEYVIPVERQRPLLLIGPPGIVRRQSWSRQHTSVVSIWYLIQSHITRDRVQSVCLLSRIRSMEMRKSL